MPKYSRTLTVVASVATGIAVTPLAVAAHGHGHPRGPVVHYAASGAADAAASCAAPASVILDHTKFLPPSIGTAGSQLAVSLNGATRYVGRNGHSMGCVGIKAGDRLTVRWTEPAGTAFSSALPAVQVIDNGPPPPVHYFAVGVADAAAVCTAPAGVTLDHTTFRPKHIGTKGSQLVVVFGTSTKYTGHRGHAMGCVGIKAGDRLTVMWTEPHGTAFSNTLAAAHVVDNGSAHHHV